MAQEGKEKVITYIKETLQKLETSPPPANVLKEKASPSIAGALKAKLAGAPPQVIAEVRRILTEAEILPAHAANLTAVKTALKSILDYVDSMGVPPAAEPPVEEEVAEKADGPVEEQEEEADGDYDPFAMMGGMGEETVYKVTMMEDQPKEPEAPAPVEEPAPAQGGGSKEWLKNYISTTLSKLEAEAIDPAKIKGFVAPKVVKSIQDAVKQAPPTVGSEIKKILAQRKVIPHYEVDQEELKGALRAVQSFVSPL